MICWQTVLNGNIILIIVRKNWEMQLELYVQTQQINFPFIE